MEIDEKKEYELTFYLCDSDYWCFPYRRNNKNNKLREVKGNEIDEVEDGAIS